MTTTEKKVTLNVPIREEVSPANQAIFDHMLNAFGKVPNLYATFALNETALADYMALQNRKSTLSAKEREIINLVVSQMNGCKYCTAAHSAVGQMVGFSSDEVLDIRRAAITFDDKYSALATFVKETTENKGRPSVDSYNKLFEAGYSKANFIDILIVIGDKIISNYLHNITDIPVDWPEVPQI